MGPFTKKRAALENKYGAERITDHAGRSFASKGEAKLFDSLRLMEMTGLISGLTQQVTVRLSKAEIVYIPDFRAHEFSFGCEVYYEFKGFETERWPIIKKLWKFYGPGPLKIFKGDYRKIFLHEEIIPREADA